VKPSPFEYHRPASATDAARLLHDLGDDAKVIAGGQSLVPMLALRLARFDHLVDIGRLAELRGVEHRNGTLEVRAATTDTFVERDTTVAAAVPLLTKVTPLIGHFQIRNRGTVGGSLAHADPAAEYPAVAVALDATFHVLAASGERSIAAADFFDGIWSTSMAVDELLTAVRFPVWDGRCGFGAAEFARRHGDFAIAGAVAGVGLGPDGTIERGTIALFGLGPVPVRARTVEAALQGQTAGAMAAEEVGRLAVGDAGQPPEDLNGSAAYRLRVGAAMAAKAWAEALEEANRA
jgi:aerobic carbon-monoxide dehydrogenase medium subunit